MANQDITALLKNAGLRVTRHRQDVLKTLFDNPNNPLSIDELVECMDSGFDRVTAYRIVNCFTERGLAERVTHLSNIVRYTLAPSLAKKHEHLVTCRVCGSTLTAKICVQSGWQDKLARLGFKDVSHNLSFTGICSHH